MMRIFGYLSPKAPWIFVYMLQQFEYSSLKFLSWLTGFPNLSLVQKRGALQQTARTKLMLAVAYFGWITGVVACVAMLLITQNPLQLLRYLLAPLFAFVCVVVLNSVLQIVVVNPKHGAEILSARKKLQVHQGVRIAVLGSYGKTTMKELLVTVLAEGKKVLATPGNKNVLISHARWINAMVSGDEDVLVFEYGEAEPGDIASLANFSNPNIAVITGIAPAHMDGYPNLEAIADDFASIATVVKAEDTYIHKAPLLERIKGAVYSSSGLGDWRIKDAEVSFGGTDFTLTNGAESLKLHTGLLGVHQIGPLTAVVAIAKKLGLTNEQIIAGLAQTTPYEHRMQARQINGAWIVDDSYNGNIEGMRAGLDLLQALPGKRKIYVTPGLVEQGAETERVHTELGKLIASANPDKVVLMQNSVTDFIHAGLTAGKYGGELSVETNPLEYYTNLEHFLASGDVVMLQNDWPDSYK